jgi:hypothetical protein
MGENTVTIALAPCTYQNGMVIVSMCWKPIATRTAIGLSAKEIWESAERMHRDYDGTHDAKVTIFLQGKKPRGYDALVKANLYKLECHRAPVWNAV